MFESFDPKPLGAASLAQVHKVKLKDGRTIALKVQHPTVKSNSSVDLKTMEVSIMLYFYFKYFFCSNNNHTHFLTDAVNFFFFLDSSQDSVINLTRFQSTMVGERNQT